MNEPLFECDFSIDELTVLADLLEVPALPGGDPDLKLSDEVKASVARGLLARNVVVTDGPAGTVDITQPYATMISMVLLADEAVVDESGETVAFVTSDASVVVTTYGGLVTWTAQRGPLAGRSSLRAVRNGQALRLDPAPQGG